MRVLFLTHNFPRSLGDPPGSFLLRLAQALRAEDVTVHVVAPAAPGLPQSDEIGGITVERFRYAPHRYETLAYTGTMAEDVARSWRARLALLGFLGADIVRAVRTRRTWRPDVVHAHWWFPSGVVGMWVSGLAGVPLVTTLHGTDLRMVRTVPAIRPLARQVLQRSAAVTTVSHWLAQDARHIGTSSDPVVAPMPVATELFTPGETRAADRILFVGRLNEQKGIRYAIRAVARLRTPATLDIVGTGPELSTYQEMAASLGIADRVVFHGQLSHHALVPLYRRASVFVAPSVDEGLGLAAVEAQLCETPVVGFESGGITDVVQQERTGVLVPPKDIEALAAALDSLLSTPTRAAVLGRAARLAALATFAPESVARRYADVYTDAIRSHAS